MNSIKWLGKEVIRKDFCGEREEQLRDADLENKYPRHVRKDFIQGG